MLIGPLVGLAFSAFVALGVDDLVRLLLLLSALTLPVLLWHFPRVALYGVYFSVCLLELAHSNKSDAYMEMIPFFWNINTIVQTYWHIDFKAIPVNYFEAFLVASSACSLVRAMANRTLSLKSGALFGPIALYMTFVFWGWVNGQATGGDFKVSLTEVRSQFYFLVAYLLAVNLMKERKQVKALLVVMVLCIGIKGALYTYRRFVTMGALPLPDQGVGSHEEAFFFDAFIMLLLTLSVFGVHRRLRWVMWALLPVVITGNLATNRRAGTGALVMALALLFLAADQAMPQRRKLIRMAGAMLAMTLLLYYQAFKTSDSLAGQPARAIASLFEPNPRDASSNAYRDAENQDLIATIRSAPLLGYGYGKPMLHAVEIADISSLYEWWDIMTHNQILWVWMRVGTPGFFAFWMMVAAVLARACRLLRDVQSDPEIRAMAAFGMLVLSMLLVFGLLDLQLSNYRDMLFVGFWTGILAVLPRLETTGKANSLEHK